ncbi:MAG TPA: DNA repair protein RadC [Sumerlaeia bacterium]|nr:DNA repair protein RadC [Sumerlaeia bacterium]
MDPIHLMDDVHPMDDIQRVDCFERLHQHLLSHEVDLQKRIDSIPPYAYRDRNLTFLLTHLVSLVCGLDESAAEGRRRIRRFVMELDEQRPADWAHEHLMIREKAEVSDKPINELERRRLRQSFQNLRELAPDPAQGGAQFDREMQRLEHLPARVAWIGEKLPCLSQLRAFHFLNRIGYPVMVPDQRCQAFFFRLGLLESVGGRLTHRLAACRVGESVAEALKRSVLEINLWVRAFVGTLADVSPKTALCRATPHCEYCRLQAYCQYCRFQRPRAQGSTAPLPVKQWRPTDRPRERLIERGAGNLEDVELLAIVLRTGSGGVNVLELARHLLDHFKTFQGIEEASLEELQSIRGIGLMKAIELKAVFELGRRQTYAPARPGDLIDSAEKVYQCYRGRFLRVRQEEFVLLMLNSKNRMIRDEVISRGGLEASIVHPREVFKAAIRASAASVIFVHNHPSGDPTPSHDDFVITQRLEEAGEFLKIRVLDHVIIGEDSFYSFTEGEILTPEGAKNAVEGDGEGP